MRVYIQFLIPLLILLAVAALAARRSATGASGSSGEGKDDALPLPWLVLIILIGAGLSVALVFGLQS